MADDAARQDGRPRGNARPASTSGSARERGPRGRSRPRRPALAHRRLHCWRMPRARLVGPRPPRARPPQRTEAVRHRLRRGCAPVARRESSGSPSWCSWLRTGPASASSTTTWPPHSRSVSRSQLVLAALSHLVPSVLGGGPSAVRAGLGWFERAAPLRVVVLNVALVLWLLPLPAPTRVVAAVAACLAVASFLPLVGLSVRDSVRVRKAAATALSGPAPEFPAGEAVLVLEPDPDRTGSGRPRRRGQSRRPRQPDIIGHHGRDADRSHDNCPGRCGRDAVHPFDDQCPARGPARRGADQP